MKPLPLVMMLIAFLVDIFAWFLYGATALSFSFSLVIFYFLGLGVLAMNAEIQAGLNPGIENLEPSFWSSVYNAWLYRTNSQKWAKYATVFAVIFSVLLGSVIGLLGAVLARPHTGLPSGTYESWFAGFFLTCSIALVIVSADYWKANCPNQTQSSPRASMS